MKAPNKVYVREYQDGDYTTWWDEKPHEEESIGMKAVCYIRKDTLLEKLVRDERDGFYTVLAKNYFWQKWKPLLGNDGQPIRFKTFKEFGEITRIESFGEIMIRYDNFQGMYKTE